MELKEQYNKLLARYKKGIEAMADVKDNKEEEQKYLAELEKIQLAMNDCLMKIGDYTDDETANGFDLSKVEVADVKIVEQVNEHVSTGIIKKESDPVMNTMNTYKDNWNMAVQLSKSDLVPDTFKNKPENCIIALELSKNMNLTPFLVMQNLSIIKGKTSWSGSFCKFLIERTGRFKDLELNYIGDKNNDTYGCFLSATRVSDGKKIEGPEVTIGMAKAENWTTNKKWSTLKSLMLAYRCQSFFARIYCPEALNGIYTDDEIIEINSENTKKIIEDVL